MRIRVSNWDRFELFINNANLETVKQVLGPLVLDNWSSTSAARIMIEDDLFSASGDYEIAGPVIDAEYIKQQLSKHIGKYFYDHWG